MVAGAGFEGFEIVHRQDVFRGAAHHSSALSYGTLGVNFQARRV